jgi:beta-aspartyl-peptidase (threonine type)
VAGSAIELLERRLNGHGGLILLDPKGRYGIAHNTPRMAWAFQTAQDKDAGIERR